MSEAALPFPGGSETLDVNSSDDVSVVRQAVRRWAIQAGLNLVEQTKIITAASELTRNIVVHGGGKGMVRIEMVTNGARRGIRITFEDHGPGIQNVELAMTDGYTTANGLGMGLGGARRLSNEFEIHSRPGEGTRVIITRWK